MNQSTKTLRTFCLVLFLGFLSSVTICTGQAADKPYHRLVILGDPHLPGKHPAAKEEVIKTINRWDDVDLVVAVGDLCEDRGRDEEYAAVKKFFKTLKKPLSPIVGNHDYMYADRIRLDGKRIRADAKFRAAKLRKFKDTFDLAEIYYSKRMGNYLLVFLSADNLDSDHITDMSDTQLIWLRSELDKNKKLPTIIFFHAPLKGTLRNYTRHINTPSRIAQPSEEIHALLEKNPQVFLWVSGHTHTPPTEESFASTINVYDKRVTNIHNTDMQRATIYTNSLYLYQDKVIVRTYNHKKGEWMPEFDRKIELPTP